MQQAKKQRVLGARAKKAISVASVVVFLLLMAALFWFVGRPLVSFVSEPQRFRSWVQAHGAWGQLAFVGMMALQIIVAIIPGEPLEIGAGYAFGAVQGTLLCLVGIVLGSALVYLFVRTFGRKAVEVFFPREKIDSIKLLQNKQKLNAMIFLAFFIPGTPKDLLSYLVGLTSIKFSTWLLISGTARIPSVITSTIGGDALGLQNYQFAILVFAITIVLSIVGLVVFNKVYKTQKS